MSDGHRSGRSTGRVSCKSRELKRCSMIEMVEILLLLLLKWRRATVDDAFNRRTEDCLRHGKAK